MEKENETQNKDKIDYSSEICLELIRKYTTTIFEITKMQEALVKENERLRTELENAMTATAKDNLVRGKGNTLNIFTPPKKNSRYIHLKIKIREILAPLDRSASTRLMDKFLRSLRNDGFKATIRKILRKLKET